MVYRRATLHTFAATLVAAGLAAASAVAQPAAAPPAGGRGGRGPAVVSPEVKPDRTVVFRINAPKAEKVTLSANDLTVLFSDGGAGSLYGSDIKVAPVPGGVKPEFKKNDAGVWEATVGPLPPGAYRYIYDVDGVRVLDPVNTRTAESRTDNWSLFTVPGSSVMDNGSVPHGAVARVTYRSAVLNADRRMHIYTPPGYEAGNQKYPVFYLLHGSGDSDDAWVSVGRATFIFDNLIASKKAKPMIVVMTNGHQPGPQGPPAAPAAGAPALNPFTNEFVTDVMPYVEKNYRTINDRQHRAIAGLSMGGGQTLDIGFNYLDRFAQIGVFSSGASLGGGGGRGPAAPAAPGAAPAAAPARPDWESTHKADLDNASLKKGTKLIWLATGVDDRLVTSTRATVEILKKHGFEPVLKETPGAHSWFNWRNYLMEFTPLLFQ